MISCFVVISFVGTIMLVRKHDKTIFNPVVVSCGLWSILLILYNIFGDQLYELSDKFYYALLLWIFPYTIIYFILLSVHNKKAFYFKHSASTFLFKRWFLLFFITFLFLYVLMKFNELSSLGYDKFFHTLREINVDKSNGVMQVSATEVNLSRVLQFSFIIWFIYDYNKYKFKLKPLFLILMLLQILSGANKFTIARFLFGYLVILKARNVLNTKKIILSFIGVALFFILFNYVRSATPENYDPIKTILIYLLSPLTAFDSFMLNSHTESLFTTTIFGEHVFASLRGTATLNPEFFENENLVYVPLPVNVFTAMSAYFVDFGWWGIFWASCFWGVIFNYVYLKSKRNEAFLILYATLFHILILQFFFDYLITSHARMNIVYTFFILFIFYHPKFKYAKQ